MSALTIGGTQSGGTSKTLTPAGGSNGRYNWVFPEHTALSKRILTAQVKNTPVSKDSLGYQEAYVDFTLTDAAAAEGCCGTTEGGVYVNVKIRYSLNQPTTTVDLALDYLQGAAFATFLEDMVKKGIISL